MKRLIIAAMLATTFAATAKAGTDDNWFRIATDDTNDWDVKRGSLEIGKTKGGTVMALVVGRIYNPTNSRVDLYKWYVSVDDCVSGMGKLVSLGVDGSYKFENDFVNSSGTIATTIAETVCGAAKQRVQKENSKGI